MFIVNQIGDVIAERTDIGKEQFQVIQAFIEALNLSHINRYKTGKTANIAKRGIL